jgi:hypothetical protein
MEQQKEFSMEEAIKELDKTRDERKQNLEECAQQARLVKRSEIASADEYRIADALISLSNWAKDMEELVDNLFADFLTMARVMATDELHSTVVHGRVIAMQHLLNEKQVVSTEELNAYLEESLKQVTKGEEDAQGNNKKADN